MTRSELKQQLRMLAEMILDNVKIDDFTIDRLEEIRDDASSLRDFADELRTDLVEESEAACGNATS